MSRPGSARVLFGQSFCAGNCTTGIISLDNRFSDRQLQRNSTIQETGITGHRKEDIIKKMFKVT